jgi:hypothetical protein
MFRRTSQIAVAAAIALAPAQLLAGGPPFLSLPVDGVTVDNADACAKLLTAHLKEQVLSYAESKGVQMIQQEDQWYLTFPMGDDVRLSDVDAALKGSDFAIARDKLRLFGHVVIEIAAEEPQGKAVLADIESLTATAVEDSTVDGEILRVTLAMPYPVEVADRDRRPAGWGEFRWNSNLGAQPVQTTTESIEANSLVSVETLSDIAARHDAKLADVRWSASHACRPLGGVAASKADVVAAGVPRTQYVRE